jgi:hypothetical protein
MSLGFVCISLEILKRRCEIYGVCCLFRNKALSSRYIFQTWVVHLEIVLLVTMYLTLFGIHSCADIYPQNCIRIAVLFALTTRTPLRSGGQSSWLQILRFRALFSALPDFLRRGSGTGSTKPREDN